MLYVFFPRFGIDLLPQFIATDFEVSAITAFQLVFPTAQLRTCHFHLSQAVLRHMRAIGLIQLFMSNDDIRLRVKML